MYPSCIRFRVCVLQGIPACKSRSSWNRRSTHPTSTTLCWTVPWCCRTTTPRTTRHSSVSRMFSRQRREVLPRKFSELSSASLKSRKPRTEWLFTPWVMSPYWKLNESDLAVGHVFPHIFFQIGMIISMPFLLATFIVYSLPELRNLHGKNLMSEVAALLTAYIVLVTTQLAGHAISDSLCVTFGKNCSIKCSIVLQLCTSSLSVVSSSLGYLLSPPKHLSLTHYPVSQYYEIKEWG